MSKFLDNIQKHFEDQKAFHAELDSIAESILKEIPIDKANLNHISKTGIINGSLYLAIKDSMKMYHIKATSHKHVRSIKKQMHMKTGIELIKDERQEQIQKHGFSLERDKHYVNGELFQAASYCSELKSVQNERGQWVSPAKMLFKWPKGWGIKHERKIRNKTRVEQLIVSGAFFMAENDRLGSPVYQREIESIAAAIDKIQTPPQS